MHPVVCNKKSADNRYEENARRDDQILSRRQPIVLTHYRLCDTGKTLEVISSNDQHLVALNKCNTKRIRKNWRRGDDILGCPDYHTDDFATAARSYYKYVCIFLKTHKSNLALNSTQ